jgi:hypothetical protein
LATLLATASAPAATSATAPFVATSVAIEAPLHSGSRLIERHGPVEMRDLGRKMPLLIGERNNAKFRVHKSVAKLHRTILLHYDSALFVPGLLNPGGDLLRV